MNGLTLTRSGNTVSDVLPGVSLKLLREGNHDGVIDASDATGTVTVGRHQRDQGFHQKIYRKLQRG